MTSRECAPEGAAAHALLGDGLGVAIPLAGIVDVAKERGKLEAEFAQLDRQLAGLRGRLANPGFTSKAPAAVVDAERAKEAEWSTRAAQLREKITAMGGA